MPKPADDPFGRHEAQHMAEFLSRAVGTELCEHPIISQRPRLLVLAKKARDVLADLYQAIGNVE